MTARNNVHAIQKRKKKLQDEIEWYERSIIDCLIRIQKYKDCIISSENALKMFYDSVNKNVAKIEALTLEEERWRIK